MAVILKTVGVFKRYLQSKYALAEAAAAKDFTER